MSNLSPEALNDIMEAIKINLTEVALGEEPQTIDQLMDSWEGSGEETKREWVVRAANELSLLGFIEPGEDPNRPLKPSRHYILHIRAKDASRTFPSDKTCIELVQTDNELVWRLIVWDSRTSESVRFIKDVIEVAYNRLATLLRMAPWRITWNAKVINEAIRKLGKAKLVTTNPRTEDPAMQLRIYEDSIKAKHRRGEDEDNVMEYDLRSCEWRAL